MDYNDYRRVRIPEPNEIEINNYSADLIVPFINVLSGIAYRTGKEYKIKIDVPRIYTDFSETRRKRQLFESVSSWQKMTRYDEHHYFLQRSSINPAKLLDWLNKNGFSYDFRTINDYNLLCGAGSVEQRDVVNVKYKENSLKANFVITPSSLEQIAPSIKDILDRLNGKKELQDLARCATDYLNKEKYSSIIHCEKHGLSIGGTSIIIGEHFIYYSNFGFPNIPDDKTLQAATSLFISSIMLLTKQADGFLWGICPLDSSTYRKDKYLTYDNDSIILWNENNDYKIRLMRLEEFQWVPKNTW